MNDEFERTNAALASSTPGRLLSFLDDALRAAWRNSSVGAFSQSIGRTWKTSSSATSIRAAAIALMIGAAMQPLLMLAMPATVVPAIPAFAFITIAVFAGVAAWQAEAMANAWRTSAAARLFRR
jgi:hypothetical protein